MKSYRRKGMPYTNAFIQIQQAMKNKITITPQERREIIELHGSNPAVVRGVSSDAGIFSLWVLEDRQIAEEMKAMMEAEKSKILPILPKIKGCIIFGTGDEDYEQLGNHPYGFIPVPNIWDDKDNLNKEDNGIE